MTNEEMRTPSSEFYEMRRSGKYQQDACLDEIERERKMKEKKQADADRLQKEDDAKFEEAESFKEAMKLDKK